MRAALFALALPFVMAALPARADILAAESRVGNWTSTTTNTQVPVPIKGSYFGMTFTTTAPNQLVRITYNAECAALGSPQTWVAVQIYVDNVEASPASGNSFALCTATSASSYEWLGAVRQSYMRVPHTGTHTVTVKGYGAGTTSWWLGDSSIVVDR